MKRIGLELAGEPSVKEMMTIARSAEDLGYDSVWLTETRFTRDAVTTAAAVAAATSRIRIGTAVVNPYTRTAVLNAVTVATLDELAEGRFIFGIGPGSPTILRRQGIAFDQPLTRLRETVSSVRMLLSRSDTVFHGTTVTIDDAQLDFDPVRSAVPIYLGVTGPRALDLAGEIADGVILNGFVTASYTHRAVARIQAAAKSVGRDPASIDIAQSIVVSVDEEASVARDAVRPMIALYLSQFPNIAGESGIEPDDLQRIQEAVLTDGVTQAGSTIRDELVAALTCAGTAKECRQQVDARRACGVTLPIVSFVHGRFPQDLRVFSN